MSSALENLFYFLAVFTIVTTFASLLPWRVWWIRACDFPRQQLFWIGSLTLALGVLLILSSGLELWVFAVLLVAVVYQAYRILPYTPVWSKDLPDVGEHVGSRFSILVNNVQEDNKDYDAVLRLANRADADILLLLEVNGAWMHHLSDLKQKYPNYILHPQENTYGMALFSKFKLHRPKVHFLNQKDVPSMSARVELPTGKQLLLWCVHPRPPFPTEALTTRPRDQELAMVADRLMGEELPVIVAGDLNDVAWSESSSAFCRLSGLKDPRIGRGQFNTFHTQSKLFRWPLDHIFLSREFAVRSMRRLQYVGSDHFPIFLETSLL